MAVNGVEYSWEDIQIVVEGKSIPLDGVVEHEYTAKKEHFNIHGRGSKPIRSGRGKEDFSGKLVLLQSEFEDWQKTFLPNTLITQLHGVNITTAYAPMAAPAVIDQSIRCRFTEIKKGMKTGDGHQTIELPYICMDIKHNI